MLSNIVRPKGHLEQRVGHLSSRRLQGWIGAKQTWSPGFIEPSTQKWMIRWPASRLAGCTVSLTS